MKSSAELKDELLKLGAVARLSELNRERELLLRILQKDEKLKKQINAHVTKKKKNYKGKHWTQKPENKERLLALRRKSNGKKEHEK